MVTVTTSWDDGDVLDERLAALLTRYGIKGTFYITKEYRKERLSDDAIRTLATVHEVGAHTLTHPNLRALPYEKKVEEIAGSKKWLEDMLGFTVPMFCYPSGLYDEGAIQAAKEAGFIGARTTEIGRVDSGNDPYQMPTTVHVYPMPFRKIDATKIWWGKLLGPYTERAGIMKKIGVPLLAFRSFEKMACAAFDIAQKNDGVFHVWGHSWEIDRYGMWEQLEKVLQYISQKDCRHMTNGEIIKSGL